MSNTAQSLIPGGTQTMTILNDLYEAYTAVSEAAHKAKIAAMYCAAVLVALVHLTIDLGRLAAADGRKEAVIGAFKKAGIYARFYVRPRAIAAYRAARTVIRKYQQPAIEIAAEAVEVVTDTAAVVAERSAEAARIARPVLVRAAIESVIYFQALANFLSALYGKVQPALWSNMGRYDLLGSR